MEGIMSEATIRFGNEHTPTGPAGSFAAGSCSRGRSLDQTGGLYMFLPPEEYRAAPLSRGGEVPSSSPTPLSASLGPRFRALGPVAWGPGPRAWGQGSKAPGGRAQGERGNALGMR